MAICVLDRVNKLNSPLFRLMHMKRFLIPALVFLALSCIHAQDTRLAQEYFSNGEYEKASRLYHELYRNQPTNTSHFERYFECILALRDYETAESALRQEMRKRPKDAILHMQYGNLYAVQNETGKAEAQYEQAIDKMAPDVMSVHRLANAFVQNAQYDLALRVYEKGERTIKPPARFTYNLADIRRRKGDLSGMLRHYLDGLEDKSVQLQHVQTLIINYLNEEAYADLQAQLFERMERNPDHREFPELLMWSYVQLKDYGNAMRQAIALDRIRNETGNSVYNLSMTAYLDGDYRTAVEGFRYVRDKGPSGSFYHDAYRQLLVSQRQAIVEGGQYGTAELSQLESDYQKYIADVGMNHLSASLVIEFAELEAQYLGKLDEAIRLLDALVRIPQVERHIVAKAKLDLGDYFLITGERWEATLLYSQVDKDFKEDELGEMARFKNARLSYFAGDFEWAQEQFDILKSATSRLISNDAIDLSVFILDNLNQDTTGESLMQYALAELKLFQNKHDTALAILAAIPFGDPEIRFLEDDVWYLQGQIFEDQQRNQEALEKYRQVLEKHSEGIRADNALWNMASIYDHRLGEPSRAMELYEKLFIDFSNSILAVEARKRFRELRGDKLQ